MDNNSSKKKKTQAVIFKKKSDQSFHDFSVNTISLLQEYLKEKFGLKEVSFVKEIKYGLVYNSNQNTIYIVKQVDKSQLYCDYLIQRDLSNLSVELLKYNVFLSNTKQYLFEITSKCHLEIDREFNIIEIDENYEIVLQFINDQSAEQWTQMYDKIRNQWNQNNITLNDVEQESLSRFHRIYEQLNLEREQILMSKDMKIELNFKSEHMSKAFGLGISQISDLKSLTINKKQFYKVYQFFENIESINSLTNLSITLKLFCEKLTNYQSIFQFIGNQSNLESFYLNLDYYEMNSSMQLLSDKLVSLSKCTKLDLTFTYAKLYDNGIEILMNAISTKIDLQVLKLQLKLNEISIEGLSFIIQGISTLRQLQVLSLDLRFEQFMIKKIVQTLPNLTQLNELSLKLELGETEIKQMIAVLTKLTLLKTLCLSVMTTANDEKEIILFGSELKLLNQLTHLTHLSLNFAEGSKVNMKSYGIESIMKSLSTFGNLSSLNLNIFGLTSKNNIGNIGGQILAKELSKMRSLRFLKLYTSVNNLTERVIQSINTSARHIHYLCTFDHQS